MLIENTSLSTVRRTGAVLLGWFVLVLVLCLPTGGGGYLDGLPWTGRIETVIAACIIPMLALLYASFPTRGWQIFALLIVLGLKLPLLFTSSQNGLEARFYSTSEALRADEFERTYWTLWRPQVSAVISEAWRDRRQFPLVGVLHQIPQDSEFSATGIDHTWHDRIRQNSLKGWLKVSGRLRLPEPGGFFVVAKGATPNSTLTARTNSGDEFAIPIVVHAGAPHETTPLLPTEFLIDGAIQYNGADWSLKPMFVDLEGEPIELVSHRVYWTGPTPSLAIYGFAIAADLGAVSFILFWLFAAIRTLWRKRIINAAILILSLSAVLFVMVFRSLTDILQSSVFVFAEPWIGPYPADTAVATATIQLAATAALTCLLIIFSTWRRPDWFTQTTTGGTFQQCVVLFAPMLLAYFAVEWWSDIARGTSAINPEDDWHSYRAFAWRIVLEGRWLEAGELVFEYQPGYRYLVGFLHIAFGQSVYAQSLTDVWCIIMTAAALAVLMRRYGGGPLPIILTVSTFLALTLASGMRWHIGRGLMEYTAMAAMMLTMLVITHEPWSKLRRAWLAGLIAIPAFWLRLDHLSVLAAFGVLLIGIDRSNWSALLCPLITLKARVLIPPLLYLTILAAGPLLLVSRNLYVGGRSLSPHHVDGVGFIRTGEEILRNFYVLLTTAQWPDTPKPAAVILIVAVLAALTALVWQRWPLRRFPTELSIVVASLIAPLFVLNIAVGYVPRFSIHLAPIAALVFCLLFCRLAPNNQG